MGSTLSPILSALYITPISYILEKRTKNLFILIIISFLLFIDDGLLISQENIFENQLQIFFVIIVLFYFFFRQFRLVIEYDKSEVFYFSRITKNLNPLSLDLRLLKGMALRPKDAWQYLEFFFDKNSHFDTIPIIMPTKYYQLLKV